MKSVNIHQAKTHLSALVEDVLAGEEVILAKRGVPLIRLIAIQPLKERVFALGKHHYPAGIPEDFDAPSAEIEELFLGSN